MPVETVFVGEEMSELLKHALTERKRLQAELDALSQFIRGLEKLVDENGPSQLALFSHQKSSRAAASAAVTAMLDDAANIIVGSGRPMTRSDLVERLMKVGHRVHGADKNKVFGTNVWRSGRFLNLKGLGYWPKSTPLPLHLDTIEIRSTIVPEKFD